MATRTLTAGLLAAALTTVFCAAVAVVPADGGTDIARQAAYVAWLEDHPAIAEAMSPEGQARQVADARAGLGSRRLGIYPSHNLVAWPTVKQIAAHPINPWHVCAYIAAQGPNPWVLRDARNYYYGTAHMTHCVVEFYWGDGGASLGLWCTEYRHADDWLGDWVRC